MASESSWEIEYYRSEAGRIPVLEWLEQMAARDRAMALLHIDQLALLGAEARPPLARSLGHKLYELRWKASSKQYRIAYFAAMGRTLVLLHGFVKKSQTTPKRELEVAQARMRDYERRDQR
jgi:phage-related protein